MDWNNNGHISINEIDMFIFNRVPNLSLKTKNEIQSEARKIFNKYDADNDEEIDRTEFSSVMRDLKYLVESLFSYILINDKQVNINQGIE
jgi:Ca2+-binding EF-hand superfamily protein